MKKKEFLKIASDTISRVIDKMVASAMPVDQALVDQALVETVTMTMFAVELSRALFEDDEDELTIER